MSIVSCALCKQLNSLKKMKKNINQKQIQNMETKQN